VKLLGLLEAKGRELQQLNLLEKPARPFKPIYRSRELVVLKVAESLEGF